MGSEAHSFRGGAERLTGVGVFFVAYIIPELDAEEGVRCGVNLSGNTSYWRGAVSGHGNGKILQSNN